MTTVLLINCRSGVIQRFHTRRAGARLERTNTAKYNPGTDLNPSDVELFRTTPDAFVMQDEPAPEAA